jgi:hypothetical protein
MQADRSEGIAGLLRAAGVASVALPEPQADELRAALDLPGDVTIASPPADAAALAADTDAAATGDRLDAALEQGSPRLLVVADPVAGHAAAHAAAWAAQRTGWLALDDPPPGFGVLAAPATLAASPRLPGTWRRPAPSARRGIALSRPDRAAVVAQEAEIDRLRIALLDQRAWVAQEAERVRATQSWRLGHRLVRLGRLLTLRRNTRTDALARLAERMRAPLDP